MSFGRTEQSSLSGIESLTAMDQPLSGNIWCSSSTGQLLRFPKELFTASFSVLASRSRLIETSDLSPDRWMNPRRPLGFQVSLLKVNNSEKLAVLAGYVDNRPCIAIAALSGSGLAPGQRESYVFTSSQGDFVFGRRGKVLQQITWVSGDDPTYFGVLSGNCFALYNAHSIGIPYATYRLHLCDMKQGEAGIERGNVTAFAFFQNSMDWCSFTVCFLRNDGAVFILCPVVVPGIVFLKSSAWSLVSGDVSEVVVNWHRAVFSRTLLKSKDSDSTDAMIETRVLPECWNSIPALQGPINSAMDLEDQDRGFQSILILSNQTNILIASSSGKVYYCSLSGVFPSFQKARAPAAAPHITVQHDCYRDQSYSELELIRAVKLQTGSRNNIQLQKTGDENTVSIIHGNSISSLWIPTLSDNSLDPLISLSELSEKELGCGWTGDVTFGCQVNNNLQMKCRLLDGRSDLNEIRSNLLPLKEYTHDLKEDSDRVDLEELALHKVEALREQVRNARNKFCEIWKDQDQLTSETSSEVHEMCTKFDELLRDVNVPDQQAAFPQLAEKYKALLASILTTQSDVDVSGKALSGINEFKEWIESTIETA